MAVHVAVKFVINKRWPVSGIVALKDAGCPPVASKKSNFAPRISRIPANRSKTLGKHLLAECRRILRDMNPMELYCYR